MKKWLLWGAGALVVLILIGAMNAPPSSETSAPETAQAAPAPPKPSLTMATFQQLATGMSYRDAVTILGSEGTEMSRNELAGTVTVMYQWTGTGIANMNAMFQNDKLVSKAQFGLK